MQDTACIVDRLCIFRFDDEFSQSDVDDDDDDEDEDEHEDVKQ